MIEHILDNILPSIEQFHLIGYWAAFFAAFLETALVIGLLIPGSSLLLLLGALSAAGHLEFTGVLWFAIFGAILGDNLNYWLGRRYGQRWLREGLWFIKSAHFVQVRTFLNTHGAKSVFLGRFIPTIKETVPFVAGTVRMGQRRFFIWNVLGAIGWGLEWVGGGYLFGQSLSLAEAWLSRAGMMLLILVMLWLLVWAMKYAVLRHGAQVWMVVSSLFRSVLDAILNNPYIQHLIRKHPTTTRFLANRTNRSHFYGLPLTLLTLAFIYVLALFAGIVEDLITADPIVALDQATAQLVATFRAPEVIRPAIWITSLGTKWIVPPLIVLTGLILWILRRPWLIVPLLTASTGAIAFTSLGKLGFHRPRPIEAVLVENTYSFPSGHATIAVAFYGFLGYLLIRFSHRWKTRVNLFFLTIFVIIGIGLSRIVLGVHYLSDIWAGYLVGALWLIIGISLSEWLTATGRIHWSLQVSATRRWLAAGLGVMALSWYLLFTFQWQPERHIQKPIQPVAIHQPLNDFINARHAAYTETLLGADEQPLGFAIIAKDRHELISTLQKRGWRQSDPPSLRNLLQLATQGMAYSTAPLAPVFWQNRINDLTFEKLATYRGAKVIDTLHIWQAPFYPEKGKQVFVGITREYDRISWGLWHHIMPDIDAATDYLLNSLGHNGTPLTICPQPLVEPMTGRYLMGDSFFTRGYLQIIDLTGSIRCNKK